ncbi:MAG: DEAD/DEAH box helicase family protein [Enterovibrio sp.]
MAMKYDPRYYQKDAHDSAIEYVKRNTAPCLLMLATGGGKSVIAAMLARTLARLAPNKKILCIAPSKELVEQNAEKFRATGSACSIFCASAGSKCLKEQVIFASPQSLLKAVDIVARAGVSAIIIDEAHGMTATMKKIVERVISYEADGKVINPHCRVIGMTATPYRTGEGYIYAIDATGKEDVVLPASQAKKPFFHKLLYKITTEELIEKEYLTPVVTDVDHESYDTSTLQMEKGKFTADSVRLTFESNETKTAKIVSEIIAKSHNRRGVIIFASTISHAKDILRLLREARQPAEIVTGEAEFKAVRARAIQLFKSQHLKFLVNVDVLTTGFDAPHIDVVALMRATESAGLMQQMIGRGLRTYEDKKDCLLLDYADNVNRHKLQINLFEPEIKARLDSGKGEPIEFVCPNCNASLTSTKRTGDDYINLDFDENGYFVLPNSSERLMMSITDGSKKDEFGCFGSIDVPVPAHYIRRCPNPEIYKSMGKPIPCNHRFSLKICPACTADNDIAARQCCRCKEPLVDVNEKLTLEASKVVRIKNEFIPCYGMTAKPHTNKSGKHSVKFTFETDLGELVAYATKNTPWILRPISDASSYCIDWNLIPHDYYNAFIFDRAPKRVKIKKDNGKIIVTGVSYEEE